MNVFDGFVPRILKDNAVEKVGMLNHGLFIIRFVAVETKDRILVKGMEFFDKKLIIMKPWNCEDDFTKDKVK